MDLTEKVAKAICARSHNNPRVWAAQSETTREHWRSVASAAIAVCAEEMGRLIDEGFDKPVGKPYRADGVPSKNDQCPHGAYMYENCEACCAAAIRSMGEKGE